MSKIKNKIVLVTGGRSGIGLALVNELNENGAIVISCGRRTAQDDNYFRCDVSKSDEVKNLRERIIEKYGKVDILINNAGVIEISNIVDSSEHDFDKMIGANLKGMFLCAREFLPDMIEKKDGMIVSVSSVATKVIFKGSGIYSSSKAGMSAMTKCLREEVRDFGIDVIDVLPGAVETAMWNPDNKAEREGKIMSKEDVAKVIVENIKMSINKNIMIEEITIRPNLGDL
jgi:3-oxoacyl-[acyl-carrier protein] reductase